MTPNGILYGVGVGPGDPELITLKTARLIKEADLITYLVNGEGGSIARNIASSILAENTLRRELPIQVPMSIARDSAKFAYDRAAEQIGIELTAGRQVVFLCEGDPFFYGSFAYLYERLHHRFECQVVPGVSSLHAAAACAGLPLALQGENLIVCSARQSDEALGDALQQHSNVVILKAGSQRARLLGLIKAAGRDHEAIYLEKITLPDEFVEYHIDQLPLEAGPYFSLFLISRRKNNL